MKSTIQIIKKNWNYAMHILAFVCDSEVFKHAELYKKISYYCNVLKANPAKFTLITAIRLVTGWNIIGGTEAKLLLIQSNIIPSIGIFCQI